MQREQVKVGVLVIVACVVAYICYLMVEPFLLPIIWASILAIIITPLHKRLLRHVKSPSLAALLACLVAFFAVVVPIGIVLTVVGQTVLRFVSSAGLADPADPEAISRWIADQSNVVTVWLDQKFGIHDLTVTMEDVKTAVTNVVTFLASQSRALLGGVAGFVFNVILVLLTLFFFLRDRDKILHALRSLLPLSERNATAVFDRVEEVIRASVIGGGAVALAQGLLALIGYWVLGVPSPFMWGAITSFASFIPFVGAAAVWVPAAIFLFLKVSTLKGVLMLAWGALAVSMVDNILRPILVCDKTALPTVLLLFSILGGLKVFGFLGIIMGPVILVIAMALIEVFRWEMRETDELRARLSGALEPVPQDAQPGAPPG